MWEGLRGDRVFVFFVHEGIVELVVEIKEDAENRLSEGWVGRRGRKGRSR